MKKVIIIGDSTHNTLSAVRSFGEGKVPFTLILVCQQDNCYVRYSKYLRHGNLYVISELGGIGNVADENGNVTNEFVKGDYFPFDNIKSDEDILSKDITRKSKAIDTSKYSTTTNDDKQLKEINTKDITSR